MEDNDCCSVSQKILMCPMGVNGAGARRVGEYILWLAAGAWRWEESFNGKRPFGNSGWQQEVYDALAREGIIDGDEDERYLHALVGRAIEQWARKSGGMSSCH